MISLLNSVCGPRLTWWLLLASWLLLAGTSSWAEPAPRPVSNAAAAPRILPPDRSATMRLRLPAPDRLRDFRKQRDFQYVEVKSEQSAWDLLLARFWHWLSELLETPTGRVVWKYGIYAALIVAAVYVVLKLMQVDLTRAFGRAPRQTALPYDAVPEDIHGLDFSALVGEAETAGNYRLAVRLGYLQVLKQLADQNLIRWQPDKTNHDYLYELPTGPLATAFRHLTQQFEYVWYGEHDDLTAQHYEQVQATRKAFLHQLTAPRRAA